MNNAMRLTYDRPGRKWEETLPVGNGSLGTMMWGGVSEELLGINQDTVWSGRPQDKHNPGATFSKDV